MLRDILAIAKKEIRLYFSSPIVYLLAAPFIFISGLVFFVSVADFIELAQKMALIQSEVSFANSVLRKFFGNMNFVMMLISPLITMKLFAEEYKNKTMDLLFMAPVSEWAIILGKYISAIVVMIFILLITLIFPITLLSNIIPYISDLLSGYLGLILNAMCFSAIGIFASSLTENQIIAAVLTVVLIITTWFFSIFSNITSNFLISLIWGYLSMLEHFDNLSRGMLTISDIVYYFSFIFIFLLITKEKLAARNI